MAGLGIECKIYTRKNLQEKYIKQLTGVSREWMQDKGGVEKRLTMTLGRLPTKGDRDCEIVLALSEERVIGFLSFVPVYATAGLSLDTARTLHETPNGLTEFLLLQAFTAFKKRGFSRVSLNFTSFQGITYPSKHRYTLILRALYAILRRVYVTNNLYTFNNKFIPVWHERYIAFEKKRFLPNYLLAIAQTEH